MSLPQVLRRLVVILHNVHAVSRVPEFAKVVYGLGYEVLVISKAVGAAAQTGVPEAHKLAFRLGKTFLFVTDLPDAVELLRPDHIYLIVPPQHGTEYLNPEEVAEYLLQGKTVALVFGGAEPGLTRRELELGKAVSLDVSSDLGPVGYAAITLYLIKESVKRRLTTTT